MVQNADFV